MATGFSSASALFPPWPFAAPPLTPDSLLVSEATCFAFIKGQWPLTSLNLITMKLPMTKIQ